MICYQGVLPLSPSPKIKKDLLINLLLIVIIITNLPSILLEK